MRRLIATGTLVAAVPLLVLVGLGVSERTGASYRVRAIFDNVAAAVPGEDVKVAGAKVGAIESMDVTRDRKAAVTLRIDDPRFEPFRSDASCSVRPQSLIGEKYVECEPGTPRGVPLREIERGDGTGEHLLPLERNSSPVDLDLVNDTLRLPYRERLAILLGELGTGLAGRGDELNAVIHRANPALRETDEALAILARQNRVLAKLAKDSDTVLEPLAGEKEAVADFIVQANETAQATAERSSDIEASIQKLPGFVQQLTPLMADLEGFADQATPVVDDLGRAAPDISRLIRELGPFSQAARPSIRSLGAATVRGRPALLRARPLIQDLIRFAGYADPLSKDLDALQKSLGRTGGIERIMDYLFFQMIAINGFDSLGHYLRAGLIVNLCSLYVTEPGAGCSANFAEGGSATASASQADLGPRLAARAKVPGEQGERKRQGSVPLSGELLRGLLGPSEDAAVAEERRRNLERLREQAQRPSPAYGGRDEPMLDYLLGGEGR